MKKWLPLIIIAGLAIVVYVTLSGKYNTMVTLDEASNTAWSNVETQYQRRADLIPNLVNTVKGYASHEKDVLESVTQARASATSYKIDPNDITPENIKKFQELQSSLSRALSRLLAVVERYPDLKANQNFLELQAQLEGTENRISVERPRYNQAIMDYNVYVRKFPNNMLSGMFGFDKKSAFEAEEGSEKVPEVSF